MATIQEQYAELLKQGQDDALAALKTWNRTIQRAFGQFETTGLATAEQVINEVYDFAAHVLDAQRELAKRLIATGNTAAERVRDGIAQAAEGAHED